jgi:hypothetical protein
MYGSCGWLGVERFRATCEIGRSGTANPQQKQAKMIRIERGAEVGPGIYEYRVWGTPIFGKSRQPLLDACRQIKAMGGPTKQQHAGVFRKGSTVADISCSVEVGALLTISEPDKARVRFVKYQEHWATLQPAQKAA